MIKQDLLTFSGWSQGQLLELLALAQQVKNQPQAFATALQGKSIVALFEKPSLRTRVSFDIGINKLGGHFVYLDADSGKLAGREDIGDMAANLSCWADAIVARVFAHETLLGLSCKAKVPVINALCDLYHPCQGLADYLTLQEAFGDVQKTSVAYIGDGNNVSHSLLIIGAILGADVRVITPKGYEANADLVARAQQLAAQNGASITVSHDLAAAEGVQALYTDTWVSMGDKTPLADIQETFADYQINQALMSRTGAEYVLHCQPAHRDVEITSELMDGDASLLLQQAENRMHAQNAILIQLLG